MKTLIYLAAELAKFFEERKWRYCFIGGLALQRWGEPRITMDVDLTLLTGLGHEEAFVEEILQYYSSRVSDPKSFALNNRVLLLKSGEGTGIDVALAGFPFEEHVVERATRFEFLPGLFLLTCSAEDLVVMKAFADRGRDWADIEGILIRQKGKLDCNYIVTQLGPLCELKEDPEILERLQRLLKAKMDS